MLKLSHITAGIEGKEVIKDLSLHIPAGEVHVIMGPNGVGKSTLTSLITGKPGYVVSQGEMMFQDKDITEDTPEVRARKGIFSSMQHPVEIPGISTEEILRTSLNEIRSYRGEERLDPFDFKELVARYLPLVGFSEEFLYRDFNVGFSGGEKKRNEILQMLLLEPKLVILDEIDSGLDIDSLKLIGTAIEKSRAKDRSFVIITHYPRLLEYMHVDKVHIMKNGTMVKTGDIALAHELEKEGYTSIEKA